MKKSLEEGEKGNNLFVLLSPKVRWPQNESGGEVWTCLYLTELLFSNFHFPINYIQLHPRTIELPSSVPPSHVPIRWAHVRAFYTPCPAGIQLSFPVLVINSVKEERSYFQYILGKVLEENQGHRWFDLHIRTPGFHGMARSSGGISDGAYRLGLWPGQDMLGLALTRKETQPIGKLPAVLIPLLFSHSVISYCLWLHGL